MELNHIPDIKAHAKGNRSCTKQNVLTEQLLYRNDGNRSISDAVYAACPTISSIAQTSSQHPEHHRCNRKGHLRDTLFCQHTKRDGNRQL